LLFGRLKIELDDAELIAEALKPDDLDWCYCYAEDGCLIVEVKTDKIGALLSAVDDYFINLKASLAVLSILKKSSQQG
jgi:tRNA threonylcarbamoyladenosine modification (KEOPS) complex  Pcc1 subunit